MAIYMNMERKLRNGGRKAPVMTEDQLFDLLKAAFYADPENDNLNLKFYGKFVCYPSLAGYEDRENELNTPEMMTIRACLNGDALYEVPVWEKVLEDFRKVKVDFENFQAIEIVTGSNGIPAVYCAFGGDWENPVAGFIYFDGKKFRGYIPTYGNVFNKHSKIAIGSEEELEYMGVNPYGKKYCFLREERTSPEQFSRDAALNGSLPADIPTTLTLSESEYAAVDWQNISINSAACLEDFSSRVAAVGSVSQDAIDKLTKVVEKYRASYDDE